MKNTNKNEIKNLAKMAKRRLKTGFWEDYKNTVENNVSLAESEGISQSNVIKYYQSKIGEAVSGKNESNSAFYRRVKSILDTYGDVSDILGRLCDETYMKTLSFQARQRYLFELAAKYRECRKRYDEEKKFAVLTSPSKSDVPLAAGKI
ncbi:MAG: hypothetical protein SOX77_04410 [Candidatus Borkfalkiaceae bacterium]|nr:hypothetical protein [Christensenellaceae bacterium]